MTSPAHEAPQGEDLGVAGEDDGANDEADNEDDALAKLTEASDQILDHWEQSQSAEVRTATVKQFIDDDTLVDLEAAGLNAEQAQSIISAYSKHVEHSILKPAGLSLDVWDSYISDDDRPAFRRACVNGEWGVLRDHARRVADYISENGDVNA